MVDFSSGATTAAAAPPTAVAASASIASTALEKKMNEQMTKGSMVIDSANPPSSNIADTNSIPVISEPVIQKSPPKATNNS